MGVRCLGFDHIIEFNSLARYVLFERGITTTTRN